MKVTPHRQHQHRLGHGGDHDQLAGRQRGPRGSCHHQLRRSGACKSRQPSRHQPQVKAELGQPGLQRKIESPGIQVPQGCAIRRERPLQNRNADPGNGQQGQEGQLKSGVEQRRRREHQHRKSGKARGIERAPVAIQQPGRQKQRQHEHCALDGNAHSRHVGIKKRERDRQPGGGPFRTAQPPRHPEHRKRQQRRSPESVGQKHPHAAAPSSGHRQRAGKSDHPTDRADEDSHAYHRQIAGRLLTELPDHFRDGDEPESERHRV